MYSIDVNKQIVSVNKYKTAIAETVGVRTVAFNFDSSWDNLTVYGCFKNSNIAKECRVELSAIDEVEIPYEVLSVGGTLYVGALGVNNDGVVKPTIWCEMATVINGVPTNIK